MQDAGSLHEFLLNLHEEYGPLASFWWGTDLVVSLASPEMFDEVKALFDRPSNNKKSSLNHFCTLPACLTNTIVGIAASLLSN
jgi:hypothetical protein